MEGRTREQEMEERYFLFGLLHALTNRLQTVGDTFFDEISWKQWFVLAGTSLFRDPPTINELAEVIGSSRQNVKQLLLKLEQAGFVKIEPDPSDRRKQRVYMTENMQRLDDKYKGESRQFIDRFYQGIEKKEIETTMQTLMKMEQNLITIGNTKLAR